MIQFQVPDMTCGHCVGVITKAIKEADAKAAVEFDLPNHLVKVQTDTDAAAVEATIRDAGYTPTLQSQA
jgi:copper chaperone